jgi:hypothetical protein
VHQLSIPDYVDKGKVLANPFHESYMLFAGSFRSATRCAKSEHVPQDFFKGVTFTSSDHLAHLSLLFAVFSKIVFIVELMERNFWHSTETC